MERQKSAWSYLKNYKFNSLLVKNFGYVFLLVTIPLLLVVALNYNALSKMVDERVMGMNEELLQKSSVVTDNVLSGIFSELNELTMLDCVVEIVQLEPGTPTYQHKVNVTVATINEQIRSNNFIESATLYCETYDMFIDMLGARPGNQVYVKPKWFFIHKQIPIYGASVLANEGNSIYFCQPVWIRGGKMAGLFVLDVNLQNLKTIMESQEILQEGTFFVTDINGRTIYSNAQNTAAWGEGLGSEYEEDIAKVMPGQSRLILAHERRVVSVTESAYKSLKYAFITEMPQYKEETAAVTDFLLTSALIGVVASILAAYIITYLTYRPMRKIINVIKNPQLHWNEKEASKQSNELLFITSNILADRSANQEISEELEDRIQALRKAQFRALQFQIDPHFLYNTLETIKWNAVEEMGLSNKTSKMLTKLARLYRAGLENDDVIISLQEELALLKLYIEIVNIRFGKTIQFHWDIDERLYDCSVIKMCLQPIVENAIQHGLRPKNYIGTIGISVREEGECLMVSVEDDGQIINEKELAVLNEKLRTGAGFDESKVGLRNVNERIKLIYGKKYGVSISGTEPREETSAGQGAGVRVVLTFPCRNFNRSEEKK